MRKIAFPAIAFVALVAVSTIAPTNIADAQTNVLADLTTKKSVKLAQAPEDKKDVEAPKTAPDDKVVVTEGDTLSSIAEAKATTWVRLYNANEQIVDPNVINPGMELRIPKADEQLTERPLPQPAPVAAAPAAVTSYAARSYTPAATTSYGLSGNAAKDFIYSRESGNNPNATNPGGCYGIGQDCNGVVRSSCGADYACQDAYFTNYAERRYGGWDGAYAFWQQNHWW